MCRDGFIWRTKIPLLTANSRMCEATRIGNFTLGGGGTCDAISVTDLHTAFSTCPQKNDHIDDPCAGRA